MMKNLLGLVLAVFLLSPIPVDASDFEDILSEEIPIVIEEEAKIVENNIYIPILDIIEVSLDENIKDKLPAPYKDAICRIDYHEEEEKVVLVLEALSDYRVSEEGMESIHRNEIGRIEFLLGQKMIYIAGEEALIEEAPTLIAGQSMLPLEAMVEELNSSMFFDEETKEIWIDIKKLNIPMEYIEENFLNLLEENEKIEIEELSEWATREDLLDLIKPIYPSFLIEDDRVDLFILPYNYNKDIYQKEDFLIKCKDIGFDLLDEEIVDIEEFYIDALRVKKEAGSIYFNVEDLKEYNIF